MNFSTRRPLLWPGLICGCLLFTLLFFVCHIFSGGGANTNLSSSGSKSVSTNPAASVGDRAKPNPTASVGDNSVPSNPTSNANPNPSSGAPELNTYTGSGYNIGYPKDWTYKVQSRETERHTTIITTTFTDSHGVNALAVGVLPNPNVYLTTQIPLGGAMQGFKSGVKNYQELAVVPQTTVSQQTWDQVAANGEESIAAGPPVNTEEIAIACNYPANSESTKLYYIIYDAPTQTVDAANLMIFQPMLASFVFS